MILATPLDFGKKTPRPKRQPAKEVISFQSTGAYLNHNPESTFHGHISAYPAHCVSGLNSFYLNTRVSLNQPRRSPTASYIPHQVPAQFQASSWEQHRELFYELYIVQGLPLREVKRIAESQHQFPEAP